jgi:hypothetical protein
MQMGISAVHFNHVILLSETSKCDAKLNDIVKELITQTVVKLVLEVIKH